MAPAIRPTIESEEQMFEYDVFLHAPDDPAWVPSFTVHGVDNASVIEAFSHADRIYLRGDCIFMRSKNDD